jgi:hypothetical protein
MKLGKLLLQVTEWVREIYIYFLKIVQNVKWFALLHFISFAGMTEAE